MAETIDSQLSSIFFACAIGRDAVLCFGRLNHRLGSDDIIEINGHEVRKPYLGALLKERDVINTALILSVDGGSLGGRLNNVVIRNDEAIISWLFEGQGTLQEYSGAFGRFLKTLSEKNSRKIFFLLNRFFLADPSIGRDPLFISLCRQTRNLLAGNGGDVQRSFWILPNLLFQECVIATKASHASAHLIVTATHGMHAGRARILDLPSRNGKPQTRRCVSLILFENDERKELQGGAVAYLTPQRSVVPLQGAVPSPAIDERALLAYLESLDENERFAVRECIGRAVCDNAAWFDKEAARNLLYNIQHYVTARHTSVSDKEKPFGMNIEYAIPMRNKAVFISGWLRDPFNRVEEVQAISDLGFRFSLREKLYAYERPAVDVLYQDSPYASRRGAWGFVAYIPVDPALQQQFEGLAALHSFRFVVTLKGGLQATIVPKKRVPDPFAIRDILLKEIAPLVAGNTAAENCLYKAVEDVQAQCVQDASIKTTAVFGAPVRTPKVSVIIPLYKCLDFLRAQIAHFSNDSFMHECQIIYVLDSPDQEEALTGLLKELSTLYDLPLDLTVMSRNYGYALACNAGSAIAKANYLLFLNSDVLPAAYGWLEKMLAFYVRQEQAGAVGAKLLYEDGAIQHAGMYFSLAQGGKYQDCNYYQNRHFFKGYPRAYPAAAASRDVPAVTGACLMIEKQLFTSVGTFSPDYIVGDFEDSDLSLACLQKDRRNYYCADVELYHMERQSMPLSEHYHPTATFLYNATLHHKRWKNEIAKVMRRYA